MVEMSIAKGNIIIPTTLLLLLIDYFLVQVVLSQLFLEGNQHFGLFLHTLKSTRMEEYPQGFVRKEVWVV